MMTPQNVINMHESLFRVLRMKEEYSDKEFKLVSVERRPESEDEKCIHILPVWHWALPWACCSRRRAFGATAGKGAAADE